MGCGPSGQDYPAFTSGKALYEHHCAGCHRDLAQGNFLKGVPPLRYENLELTVFVDLIQGHRRAPDTKMPIFDQMQRDQIEAIAQYLHMQIRQGRP
ncbi:c-type cytochrome [Caldichromatium japonicum]|uniref:C-type cytochrome n=1 Tax=Caldichromatium japonicum TaxID=2699430 RepID=A0A6G7VEH5_9GAMM|nr:cytochrome c [Caldichromatium japonicum]QIK38421.1 c-type cytochrome [Caldichromatium japonicum]